MNRKERRAILRRGKRLVVSASADDRHTFAEIADLSAKARSLYREGLFAQAQDICNQTLAHESSHVPSLNLLGLIAQASGRHKLAIKMFSRAITSDEMNAACHYNVASSYQALDRWDDAVAHFKRSITLGMGDENVEQFILQSPAIAACLDRVGEKWPLPIKSDELFGPPGLAPIANDALLRSAMESTTVRGVGLEIFLTYIRSAMLQLTMERAPHFSNSDANVIGFYSALAQQCFINEYIFAQGEEEIFQARQLRDLLHERLSAGSEIPVLLLITVAAYFPLHSLPMAESLLSRDWPETLDCLLDRQIREPLEEARDRKLIPNLTTIEDGVSLEVKQQYEENPYPRWINNRILATAGEPKMQTENDQNGRRGENIDILIAGCGTGHQAFRVAQMFPEARVLAIDLSLTSLAYARRMTREAGVHNVEYAQADILKLGTIGRSFDRIEAMGVLHHLADPNAGWEVLISLLRANGEMHIGLYSEIARRPIVDARAFIAARAFRPTTDDIRVCRQEIIREKDDWRWKRLTFATDFYSMSGCRDLLFNVMEYRFTIPEIKAFLSDHGLSFLGFDISTEVIDRFQQQFPGTGALTELDSWHVFEAANPQTFWNMYRFSVCRVRSNSE